MTWAYILRHSFTVAWDIFIDKWIDFYNYLDSPFDNYIQVS